LLLKGFRLNREQPTHVKRARWKDQELAGR